MMRLSLSGASRVRRAAGGTLVGSLESYGELASRRPIVACLIVIAGGLLFGHGFGDVWVWVVGGLFSVGLGVRSCLRRPGREPADSSSRRLDVRRGHGAAGVSNDLEVVKDV